MSISHRPAGDRTLRAISATLLVAGSLLFLGGGRQHPDAATAFGESGTQAYFTTFAATIHHSAGWKGIHLLILLGPLLWALALPLVSSSAVDDRFAHLKSGLRQLAGRAIAIGAALWVVAFVLDGYAAPVTSNAIVNATAADLPGLIITFRVHQLTMVTLGLFSWILIGISMALHGTLLTLEAPRSITRTALGGLGILIGVWPIIAAVTGEFDPGPFTSGLWRLTALSSALWFAALGVSFVVPPRGEIHRAATTRSDPVLQP